MKQISRILSFAAAAAMCFSACSPEELKNGVVNVSKFVTVHFGTENTDPASTKATLTPNAGETAFQAAWENEDKISVKYSNDSESETATGTTTATWNGTSFESKMPEYTGMWIYDAAYPVPSESDSSVDFGPNRTQKGNAYNSKYDIMIGSAVAEKAAAGKDYYGNDIVFQMDRQTAIAYFHFTSDLDEAVTSATLTVGGNGAAIASNSAFVSDFAWAAYGDCQSITITFPEAAPNAQDFQLWFNVLPTNYASMTLTVETATKRFTISKKTEGQYVAGKLYKVNKGIEWTDKLVTDVITADKLTATGSSYADFSDIKITSSAVYAGQSAKSSNDGIQLRSKYSNSGIVTTVSGGKAKKISIVTESGTNTIDIYGKATPYTDATNLYATENGDQGTKLGSLKCGTDTELEIVGDYPYIGIRSNSGAIYLTSISITWESGSSEPAPDTYTVSCATVPGGTLSATPSQASAGAKVTLKATPDKGYAFNNDWTVTNAETGKKINVTNGTFTMPAANVNVSASFAEGVPLEDITLTLDFSKNIFSLSTEKANGASNETSFSYDSYSYKVKATTSFYYYSSKATFIGNKDSYITFPAIENYRLKSVAVSNCAGASSKASCVICPTSSTTAVAGGAAATIRAGSTKTWTTTGTEINTAYRFYITNANAVQMTKVVLVYTAE